MGETPETKISQPKKGGHREEGPFKDGKLVLSITPIRIDWLYTVPDVSNQEDESIPKFSDKLQPFLQLMNRWFELSTCPAVQRLAFGAILLHPVEDRESGYRFLQSYLPSVKLDAEGSSDFSYQINRPIDSRCRIDGLRINRLSKWSVNVKGMVELSFQKTSVKSIPFPSYHICRLELDVNTVDEFEGKLKREQLPQVFEELIDLGKDIAIKGDIK